MLEVLDLSVLVIGIQACVLEEDTLQLKSNYCSLAELLFTRIATFKFYFTNCMIYGLRIPLFTISTASIFHFSFSIKLTGNLIDYAEILGH